MGTAGTHGLRGLSRSGLKPTSVAFCSWASNVMLRPSEPAFCHLLGEDSVGTSPEGMERVLELLSPFRLP